MQAVYLAPHSTFPDSFPSNTLFGAICHGLEELGQDVGALIDAYRDATPFLISSCFPYLGNGKKKGLFPMPLLPPHKIDGLDFEKSKKLNKVRWVDNEIFTGFCSGNLLINALVRDLEKYQFDPAAGILSMSPPGPGWRCAEVDIPHNQINRKSTMSEQFYHARGTHFNNCGLWFLIDFQDRSWESAVMGSLRLLADKGIGSRRSTGQGSFGLSIEQFPFPLPDKAPYTMTLSRMLPDTLAPFGGEVWYDLVPVRGRTTDGMAKQQVMMLSEGSLFKSLGTGRYGRIARVREDPPMVEYGIAFPVGMRCLG